MNGGQRTLKRYGLAQFFERQIGLASQQASELLLVARQNHRLAPRITVARPDISSATALLQQLFDHTQGHTVAPGNIQPSAFSAVVGTENPFAQVQQ